MAGNECYWNSFHCFWHNAGICHTYLLIVNMKLVHYFYTFIFLGLLFGCKKDPVSIPVDFTTTTYETLGYDQNGKPNFLLKDDISSDFLSFTNSMLPNGINLTKSHPELFSNPEIADITITNPSDVYITFISQNGSKMNSIAFYTYPTQQPPLMAKDIALITYIFPNAGRFTPLAAGDKIKIGKFDPGTSIGFVLMQDAWDIKSKELNNKAVHFCTNDALNPEVDPKLKKHAVLIKYKPENKILVGFEDLDRTSSSCDNDFNDVVFYTTVVEL